MARVLIADDSAIARKCLRKIIAGLGHDVVGEVNNGSQAFVEYTKLKPDIVTMDLTMHGLGGAEATSKIIAFDPEAKIVVISAMEERRVVIDALERGARHFIIKPITEGKVAAVLKNVLQQEFDLKTHVERVKRLKSDNDTNSLMPAGSTPYLSPYIISCQQGGFVHVVINQSISPNSFQSMVLELNEHLQGNSRVMLDFGKLMTLDQEVLARLNKLIGIIQCNDGRVKALSHNKRFVEAAAKVQYQGTPNLLGEVLRYCEG